MKAVKVIVAVLAGAYALYMAVSLVRSLLAGEHPSALMGAVAGGCLGAALCVGLLQSAFRKPKKKSDPSDEQGS